ncbi:MAG: FAD-dependent oxidoreductase, partial [Ruegeria sp.]
MGSEIIVVGAGIVGASIAYQLARTGHTVTVIDRDMPGAGASGRSFGWINASFYLDMAHHELRA